MLRKDVTASNHLAGYWLLGEQSVPELCRRYGYSKSSYYKWKTRYGGMEASDLPRLHELEEEYRCLKQIYAELSLKHRALKDIVEKSCDGGRASVAGHLRYSALHNLYLQQPTDLESIL